MTAVVAPEATPTGLERVAYICLLTFAAAIQLSIAVAGIVLTLTAILWLAVVIRGREPIRVPPMFWPLVAYAVATLIATVFSIDPWTSLVDDKTNSMLQVHVSNSEKGSDIAIVANRDGASK